MNKNIIIVGAIAAGLYLLSQGKKSTITTVKKKAPQRPKRKYPKPHIYLKPKPRTERVIAKKKAIYNKPKIKKATARKKPTYRKSIPRRVIAKKKAIYNKPKIKKAILKKKMNKNFHHIAVKHQRFWLRPKPKHRQSLFTFILILII